MLYVMFTYTIANMKAFKQIWIIFEQNIHQPVKRDVYLSISLILHLLANTF